MVRPFLSTFFLLLVLCSLAASTSSVGFAQCSYSLSHTSVEFDLKGGSSRVSVLTGAGCGWTATTSDTWINITFGASSTGSGWVIFSVQPYIGISRTGTITIAGHPYKVVQIGAIWEQREPMTTTESLRSAWSTLDGQTFVVGGKGVIFRGDGAKWTIMSSPTNSHLYGVWGSSATNVFAVGDAGTILRYASGNWGIMSSGITSALYGVWGNGATAVFAVGAGGTIVYYNGTGWTSMTSGTSEQLNGVWGSSGTDVFAVGSAGKILRFNGSSWSSMTSGTTQTLRGVWGTSSGDVYAVGDAGVIHYNGVSWSPMAGAPSASLYSIGGNGVSDVFAVGSGSLLHYNGTAWSSTAIGSEIILYGLCGTLGNQAIAVGNYGTILEYNGTTWKETAAASYLTRVWGTAGSDVFAVGGSGRVLHYDGVAWDSMPSGTSTPISDIWGSSASNVYAAAADSLLRYDGSGWNQVLGVPAPYPSALWGFSAGDIFGVGSSGTAVRYNGTSWTSMATGTTVDLKGVWGTSGSDVFAVGNGGTIIHYNGTAWTPIDCGCTVNFRDVWGSSATDVFAVGDDTRIFRYNGTTWSSTTVPWSVSLSSVWGRSNTDVLVAGAYLTTGAGIVLRYNGTEWRVTTRTAPLPPIAGVYGTSGGDLIFVSGNGSILQQTWPPCNASISPSSIVFGTAGGSSSFQFSTSSCPWTATSSSPWLHIQGTDSGLGNATIQLTVDPNTGSARKAVITVAGLHYTVSQLGTCSYGFSSTSIDVPAGPGSYSVTVTSGGACQWTAVASHPWITIDSGSVGTGNGTVNFSVTTNPGPARVGAISIAGQNVMINQAGGYVPYATSLRVVKTHSGNAWLGQQIAYLVTVTNDGPLVTTEPVTVTDVLPAGLTYLSSSGTGWGCACAGQTVTCTRESQLQPGASTTLTITARVTRAAYPTVTNSVSVAYAGETNSGDNSSSDPATVTGLGRAFVSSSGDDGNMCSAVSPCRTLARALDVLLPGGELVVLDSGGFGAAVVTIPVSIFASLGIHAGVTVGTGAGLTINAPADAVVILRGLQFNSVGGANAIRVDSVGTLFVEQCQMTGFTGHGIDFRSNGRLVMKGTDIRNCGGSGLFVSPPSQAAVSILGGGFSGNNLGIEIQSGTTASIGDSACTGNTIAGVRVQASAAAGATASLRNVSLVDNGVGLAVAGGSGAGQAVLSFAYSLVTRNGTGIVVAATPNSSCHQETGTSVVVGNDIDVAGTVTPSAGRQ